MSRTTRRQRPERRRRWGRGRAGLALVAVLVVLGANAVVFSGTLDRAAEVEAASSGDVAAAAEPAERAGSALDANPDPLAGVVRHTAPTTTEVDAAAAVPVPVPVPEDPPAVLPVPEVPPDDPYAPEPEIRHGTLEIPAIGLSQPLFEGVSLTAINRGPSHWPGTAMPGELGNVVVAGHRSTYTRPFWDLQALRPGDELVFAMADGARHVYALDRLEIVGPEDVHIIDQTHAHTATLFACHPRGSARQRIVGHFTLRSEPNR